MTEQLKYFISSVHVKPLCDCCHTQLHRHIVKAKNREAVFKTIEEYYKIHSPKAFPNAKLEDTEYFVYEIELKELELVEV